MFYMVIISALNVNICQGLPVEDVLKSLVEVEGGIQDRGHMYLWPIHTNIWQKASQYCKVVGEFQLK